MSAQPEPNAQAMAGEAGANPGYALGQLARAFATGQTHDDPTTRARAWQKVADWIKVFEGMLRGALRVGSRTPVAGTPPWATLRVIQGGFTTGDLLAGGPLQPHEEELLSRLAADRAVPPRAVLNSYYVGEVGLAELRRMLASGCYRVNVPEEGALPVVVWLLEHGHADEARAVLDEIAPFFAALRFYPVPAARPLPAGAVVHLETVGQVAQALQAQREATLVWAPLCDRAVELFAETIDGPPPSLQKGPDGKPMRTAEGKFLIEGGWPCQRYPDGWQARAWALLDDYSRLRAQHHLCGKPERRGETFTILRGYLEVCARPEAAHGPGRGHGPARLGKRPQQARPSPVAGV